MALSEGAATEPVPVAGRSDRPSGGWIGPAALLSAVILWGFVPTSTRHVVGTLGPEHILMARFTAGLIAAVVAFGLLRASLPPRALWPRAIGLGLLGQLGFNAPLAYGLRHVEAGTSALINATSPIFIAVLVGPLLGEHVRPRVVAGLVVALSGSCLVAVVSGGEVSLTRDQLFGSLLILTAAIVWGVYSVIVKPWLGPIPPMSIPLIGSFVGFFLVAPFGLSGFGNSLGELDAVGWLAVAQFTLLAGLTAPILWAIGLQRGQASRAGVYLYITPLVGVAASAILLDEVVSIWTIAGGLLILAGLLIATVNRRSRNSTGATGSKAT